MKEKKKKKKDGVLKTLADIVLVIAGVTLLGAGLSTLTSQAGRVETDAVISELTEEPYSVGEKEKTALSALVTYTVEGVSYTSDLGGVKRGFTEGGKVTVLVAPDAPQDAVLPRTAGGAVCAALGAALLLCGLIRFFPLFRTVLAAGQKRNDPIPVE